MDTSLPLAIIAWCGAIVAAVVTVAVVSGALASLVQSTLRAFLNGR